MLTKLNALKNNSGFNRYFKNTSWMMGEHFLRLIAGMFVSIWVARHLGPEQFGLFSYVLAFTAIFSGIAKIGLDSIMVRELVHHPENRDAYLGTAFWLKILGAMLVMIVLAVIVPFTSNEPTTNLFIFIVAAGLVFQSFEVVQFYFQSQVLGKIITICKLIQLAFSSIIKIYLVITEAELIYFVLVVTLDTISLAVSYSIAYKIRHKSAFFFRKFDLNIAKKLTKDGLPLLFAGLGFTLFSNIDAVMIKEMISEEAVGIYMAAYKLTVLWYFLPGLVLNSVMPAIVKAKDNKELFIKRGRTVTGVLVWFAIILATLTTFFSDEIIYYTFGKQYIEASNLLVLLIWINVIIFFNSCWNYIQMINNKTKLTMYFHLLTALFNILFNFFLIPAVGLMGAAYAILLSLLISMAIFAVIDKQTIPLLIGSLLFWR